MWGGVRKASNVRKCRFKRTQLHRFENVGLKALLDTSRPDVPECLEILRFGCLPKPLQKRTVWWSFPAFFCVLLGGVRKGSNVRKCRFKRTQLHRLEKVDVKELKTAGRQHSKAGSCTAWKSKPTSTNRTNKNKNKQTNKQRTT